MVRDLHFPAVGLFLAWNAEWNPLSLSHLFFSQITTECMDAMPGKIWSARALFVTAVLSLVLTGTQSEVVAATFSTKNFTVTAPTDDVARRVANCAEYWRRELAIQWLDQPLPNWYRPCPITVKVGQISASGQTTFTFENGEVHGWKMHVQGTLERVLDSVIPHEVNHTIFASHFRRPLPRWADEGAATLFEHESEQYRQMELLQEVFHTTRRIPLKNLLAIREYPSDMRDVLTLYAEGYSLAGFLVGMKGDAGRKIYLQFLDDAHHEGWEKAIAKHYQFQSIDHLEKNWTQWILAGSPPLNGNGTQLAATSTQAAPAAAMTQNNVVQVAATEPELVVRSQSPQQENAPEFATSRVSEALPSIPRRLRVKTASLSEDDVSEQPIGDQSVSSSGLPRPTARLSPTTDGVKTSAGAPQYQFPEARQ